MDTLLIFLTYAAGLGSGLMGGLFFAFSTGVMPALARLPSGAGISAMQSINVAILNRWFLTVYLGTALVSVALLVASLVNFSGRSAKFIMTGTLLYLLGCIVVTGAFNIPLNNKLAAVSADSQSGIDVWLRYLSVWVRWNHVRTVACLAALSMFIAALFEGRAPGN